MTGAGIEDSSRLRAFIALVVPEEAKLALLEAQERMKARAKTTRLTPKWIDSEQLHLTVKFLGDIPRADVPTLERFLRSHAAASHPIETQWTGAIAFGGPHRAGTIVAGVADPTGAIETLAAKLDISAEGLGIEPERRTFRPHVTLARVKPRANVMVLLEAAGLHRDPIRFTELRFYESKLTQDGAIHTLLASAKLGVG